MVGWKCFPNVHVYICVCWDFIFNVIVHSSLLLDTDWPPGFARHHQEESNAGRTNFTDLRPLSYGHLQSGAPHIMASHHGTPAVQRGNMFCSHKTDRVQIGSFHQSPHTHWKKGFTTRAEPSYHPSFPSKPSSSSHQHRLLRIKFTLPPRLLAPVCYSDCYSSEQHGTVVLSCLLFSC